MEYLYDSPNLTDGFDGMLVDISEEIPQFVPMFLLFVFMVVFISGSSLQKRRTGSADMAMWSTIASLSTLMVSLAMTIIGGLINLITLIVVVCITIMSGAWLFLDKTNREI